ncbi:3-carboxyethylcatechol 2,3-dioxygenase [Nocardia testacea]|uniref:3-carboxyethylcatechol 2,3-dioxygenase n=1 Tax=Nocardia testacea TaxID=248551 RepID=UPI000304F72F|nr:3-carboxyethylcatechol 2,3-dioxygenase [Nocardia testacea]
MPLAVCCVSHSPLLELPGPGPELRAEVGAALDRARDFVRSFDPELVVLFAPDHYNGFFYKLMPPFCVGTAATAVGDYGTHAGPLRVPEARALRLAEALLDAGIDIAISAQMSVDHGTVQPLQRLFGDATARPVIPVFVNSVATPLGPLRRVRALGTAVGRHLATLGTRVLVIGSGGLSHDPPVPQRATAPEPVLERIVYGRPMSTEQRAARQTAVIAAARDFAAGDSPLRALNPEWDRAFLELVDTGRLAAVDDWDNGEITRVAGNSAHEVRTWVAAFAALAAHGAYRTEVRYYRPAPELIAGFAVRTARPADEPADDRRR